MKAISNIRTSSVQDSLTKARHFFREVSSLLLLQASPTSKVPSFVGEAVSDLDETALSLREAISNRSESGFFSREAVSPICESACGSGETPSVFSEAISSLRETFSQISEKLSLLHKCLITSDFQAFAITLVPNTSVNLN